MIAGRYCSNKETKCKASDRVNLLSCRYGKDHGVVEEACSPYTGNDTACSTRICLRSFVLRLNSQKSNFTYDRHFTSSYGYVGGYYGGCSEEAMKEVQKSN